jgi:hypothetical protein
VSVELRIFPYGSVTLIKSLRDLSRWRPRLQ